MRSIILTAGRGDRLRPITGNRPKCLATVGSCTILERQLRTLRASVVLRIDVITGYRTDDVHCMSGPPRYASTNSLYSLWLARDPLREGFVVLNCDVVFHRQLLTDVLTARYEDALLVAFWCRNERYSDEEVKLRVRNGRVTEISKSLRNDDADGESLGSAKFGATGAGLLVKEMDRLVAAGAIKDWASSAFAGFCQRRLLHVVDHGGLPWIEIDSPNDYWRACTHIAPVLDDVVPVAGTAVRMAADHV